MIREELNQPRYWSDPFKVQVCRIAEAAFFHRARMGASGVKPYVHRIGFLREETVWRMFVRIAFRNEILGVAFEPYVGSVFADQALLHNQTEPDPSAGCRLRHTNIGIGTPQAR